MTDKLLPCPFSLGDRVRKTKGSWWEGKVVGFYSTDGNPHGVAVQLDMVPNGPVQIYPAAALELAPPQVRAEGRSTAGQIGVNWNSDVESQRDGAEAGEDDDDTLTHGGPLVLDVLRVGVGSDAGRGFGVARDHDGFPPNESHQQTTEVMVPFLTIPPGWKLVPEEPTEEMKVAGEVSEIRNGDAAAIYRAMLATSPQPLKAVAPCGNNGDKDP